MRVNPPLKYGRILHVILLLTVFSLGCQKKTNDPAAADDSKPEQQSQKTSNPHDVDPRETNEESNPKASNNARPQPQAILRTMFAAYKAANSYSDDSVIRLRYQVGDKTVEEVTKFRTRFSRPNQIHLQVERERSGIKIWCDGQHLRARISDPTSNNFAGQIAQQASPQQLQLENLYSISEYADVTNSEVMMSVLFGLPIQLDFSQVALLLSKRNFDDVFLPDSKTSLLEDKKIQQSSCFRLRVADSKGRFPMVFWVDKNDFRLHRLEFPVEHLYSQLNTKQVTLTADFRNVNFGAKLPASVFNEPTATNAKFVRFFVKPPAPLPNNQFGKTIPPFAVSTLDGQNESSSHLKNKLLVLIWFDKHEPSRFVLREIEAVRAKYKKYRDRIAFRAVCAEPANEFTNDDIRKQLHALRISMPIARDTRAVGRDVLGIVEAPSLVVLGKNRKMHLFEVGANPQIAETVDIMLQSLLRGVDVGGQVVSDFRKELQAFQRKLASVALTIASETPQASKRAAKQSQPKRLQLARRWENRDVPAAGNLLALSEQDGSRICVVSELKGITVLDETGKVLSNHAIQLANDDSISILKSHRSRDGTRHFLAFSRLGKRVYLLDNDFKLVQSYPTDNQPHPGIQDAMIADLDKDSKIEIYVAFGDPVGIHRVDTNGKRTWSSRSVTGIQSLVIDRNQFGRFLCAGQSGLVHPVFVNGQPEKKIAIGDRSIHSLVEASKRHRATEYLGWSSTIDGRLIAVGLNKKLEEQWSYGLPNGIYTSQVQQATHAKIIGANYQWILAAPDGSVHIVADDGSFFDSFNFGEHIAGICGLEADNGPNLIVSTTKGITAIELRPKQD
jgi:outer membrane lipoprotein-sorting protein